MSETKEKITQKTAKNSEQKSDQKSAKNSEQKSAKKSDQKLAKKSDQQSAKNSEQKTAKKSDQKSDHKADQNPAARQGCGEVVYLTRDTRARMVPSGAIIVLQEGTEVLITQELGNSYTVNVYGNLARIDGVDADALDKEPYDQLQDLPDDVTLEDKIWIQLKTVFDPEIPVNIVDLGLIYGCDSKPLDDGCFHVDIRMTLTSPGCGMGPVIAEDCKTRVLAIPEVATAEVDISFDPFWDESMMSEAAKLELGWL